LFCAFTNLQVQALVIHIHLFRLLDARAVNNRSATIILSDATGQIIGNDGLHAKVLAHVSLVSKVQQLSRDRQERWRCLSDINRRWSRTSFYSDSATRAVVDATTLLSLDQ
jgi:hypothetical protein